MIPSFLLTHEGIPWYERYTTLFDEWYWHNILECLVVWWCHCMRARCAQHAGDQCISLQKTNCGRKLVLTCCSGLAWTEISTEGNMVRTQWFYIGLRVGNCNLRMNLNENSKGMSHNRSELNWNVNTDKNCFCESACKFKKTNHTRRKRHALPVPLVGDESWRATDSGLTMLQEWVGYIYIYLQIYLSMHLYLSVYLSIFLSLHIVYLFKQLWICLTGSLSGYCSLLLLRKLTSIFMAKTWKGPATTHVRSCHLSWLENCKHHLPSDALPQCWKLTVNPHSHQGKKSQL